MAGGCESPLGQNLYVGGRRGHSWSQGLAPHSHDLIQHLSIAQTNYLIRMFYKINSVDDMNYSAQIFLETKIISARVNMHGTPELGAR